MAKKIKTIHDRINFAVKKGQTGYFSPTKLDDEIYAEVLNLWKKYVAEFEATQLVSTFLDPFKASEDCSPNGTTGIGTLTAAYQYPTAVRVISNGKKIDIVDRAHWDNRVNHPIEGPTADYPICTFENKQIIVRPVNIGDVQINYLKKPTKPVYAYDNVSDRYVYNDSSSVEIEFDESLHDEIINRVLGNLGVPMREEFLVRVSQQEKMTEGK